MTKKSKTMLRWILLVLGLVLLCPFPTRIAQPLRVEFSGHEFPRIAGLRVSQSWETFGLFGGGHETVSVDALGVASFPARYAYGSIATRSLARAITFIAIHSSYGARITVEFTLPPLVEVRFDPSFFTALASGSYRDADTRYYFPQVSEKGQRVMVSGDFVTGSSTLRFPVEKKESNKRPEPMAVLRTAMAHH